MRNDIHSPKNFVPADYEFIGDFGTATDPYEEPPFNKLSFGGEFLDAYEASAMRATNPHPDYDHCDLCGARFIHGAVLEHVPTGRLITVGGICMTSIAGVPATSKRERLTRGRAAAAEAKRIAGIRAVLANYPGLNAALKVDKPILKDLRAGLIGSGFFSEKMAALAFRVAGEPADAPLCDVPDTDKRIKVSARIVTTKSVDNAYGSTLKGLFLCEGPDGMEFKLWGSVPSALKDIVWNSNSAMNEIPRDVRPMDFESKGSRVEFMARVERSKDDPTFGFFKRPTKVSVIALGGGHGRA